jgi:hypothetical protein
MSLKGTFIYLVMLYLMKLGVYPFAKLHPNAGVRLREEISLLPSHLYMLVPSSNCDGVCLTNNDSCLINFPNHANESAEEKEGNSEENSEDQNMNGEEINPNTAVVPHFMQERSSLADLASASDHLATETASALDQVLHPDLLNYAHLLALIKH